MRVKTPTELFKSDKSGVLPHVVAVGKKNIAESASSSGVVGPGEAYAYLGRRGIEVMTDGVYIGPAMRPLELAAAEIVDGGEPRLLNEAVRTVLGEGQTRLPLTMIVTEASIMADLSPKPTV